MTKQVEGIWLPDYETHLVDFLHKGPKFYGKGTYQFQKFAASFPFIKNFRHAVDVGAHVGLWSRVFERCFTKVTAFEPVPAHRECFKKNVPGSATPPYSEVFPVELIPFALGDTPGTVHMLAHMTSSAKSKIAAGQGSTGDVHVVPKGYGDIEVEIRTLDSFNLTNVDYVKIDVEGYEGEVVRGAQETLTREKPIVVVEQKGHEEKYFNKPKQEALELLKRFGMKPLLPPINGDWILGW